MGGMTGSCPGETERVTHLRNWARRHDLNTDPLFFPAENFACDIRISSSALICPKPREFLQTETTDSPTHPKPMLKPWVCGLSSEPCRSQRVTAGKLLRDMSPLPPGCLEGVPHNLVSRKSFPRFTYPVPQLRVQATRQPCLSWWRISSSFLKLQHPYSSGSWMVASLTKHERYPTYRPSGSLSNSLFFMTYTCMYVWCACVYA